MDPAFAGCLTQLTWRDPGLVIRAPYSWEGLRHSLSSPLLPPTLANV